MISRRRLAFPLFGLFFAAQAFTQGGAAAPADIKVETLTTVPQWGVFETKISGLPADIKGIAAFFTLQDASQTQIAELADAYAAAAVPPSWRTWPSPL